MEAFVSMVPRCGQQTVIYSELKMVFFTWRLKKELMIKWYKKIANEVTYDLSEQEFFH